MEQKKNYQIMLDTILKGLGDEAPTLMLHSCCAPCSSYVLEYLAEYFKITVVYYNPNISPEEEFRKREEEQRRLIAELPVKNPITLLTQPYDPKEFYDAVRGLENEPEGGKRCFVCYRLRLERAARLAKEQGFDWFTTTLTLSPLKNSQIINRIAEEVSQKYGVKNLPSDFKKREGYKRSIELSREYGLYRQNYCGCEFSKRDT
ncbi:MAG: epoxyqueuosine reductase QueH [Ruminococcus sp.]|nr:epoxyqueuosine reductase QueH [Ruminococcus sp.]